MPRECVLLIEDEARLRNNLQILLRRDYDVTPAARGDEGLDLVQRQAFNLVVTDLIMENFEQFDLLDRLFESVPETPIIAMSGHASILTPEEAMRRGARAFLAKPFAIGDLRNAIAQILRQDNT